MSDQKRKFDLKKNWKKKKQVKSNNTDENYSRRGFEGPHPGSHAAAELARVDAAQEALVRAGGVLSEEPDVPTKRKVAVLLVRISRSYYILFFVMFQEALKFHGSFLPTLSFKSYVV